jgi:putative membrane protein insertion efficiency factor
VTISGGSHEAPAPDGDVVDRKRYQPRIMTQCRGVEARAIVGSWRFCCVSLAGRCCAGSAYTRVAPYPAAPFRRLPVARLNQREAHLPTQQSKAEEASRLQGPHEDAGRPCDLGPAPQEGAGEPLRLRPSIPLAIDPPLTHARSPERSRQAARRGAVPTGAPGRISGRGGPAGRSRSARAGGDQDRVHRRPGSRGGSPSEQSSPRDAGGLEDGRSNRPAGNARGAGLTAGHPLRPHGRGSGRTDGAASKNRRDERLKAVLIRAPWWAGAPVRASLIGLIRLYRVTVGQLLGGQCRFYPSCSSYAEGAIRELGWIRGSVLSIWRIARCNPFSAGGVDHPPRRADRAASQYDNIYSQQYDAVIHTSRSAAAGASPAEVEGLRRGPGVAAGGSS